jgi:anti-sigma-K factor RskA
VVPGACALLALGMAGGSVLDGSEPGPPAQSSGRQLVLEPLAGQSSDAAGRVELGSNEATVRVTGLEPVARGDFYELWLLAGSSELVSLGSFRVSASGEAEVRVPIAVDPGSFEFLDISREPATATRAIPSARCCELRSADEHPSARGFGSVRAAGRAVR